MSYLSIDFEWSRDLSGYELREADPPQSISIRPPEGGTLRESAPQIAITLRRPLRIVRRGGKLQRYRPLDASGSLARQFADSAKTTQGALIFVNQFGPLTRRGQDKNDGDDVRDVIAHATQIGRLLTAYERGDKTEIARTLGPKGKEIGESTLSTIEVRLALNPGDDVPKLRLTVQNLLTALWLQAAQVVAGGVKLRTCQRCGVLFEVGPRAGRRGDAKFCSNAHRIEFNNQHARERANA